MIFALALLVAFAVCCGHMAYLVLRLHNEAQDDSRYNLEE